MLYSVQPPDAEPLLDRQERGREAAADMLGSKAGGLDMLEPAAPLHQCTGQVRAYTDFGAGISCAAIAWDPYIRPLPWPAVHRPTKGVDRPSVWCVWVSGITKVKAPASSHAGVYCLLVVIPAHLGSFTARSAGG